jgi:hypothetical protein
MLPDDFVDETLSTTGAGAIKGDKGSARRHFAMSVSPVGGSGTTWTVLLQGSMDQANWTTILTHTDIDPASGQTIYSGAAIFPCLYHRANVTALSLGSATGIRIQHLGI